MVIKINDLWFPKIKIKKEYINTYSWFDILKSENPNKIKQNTFIDTNIDKITRTKKIQIYPNKEQKKILQKWFNNYIDVYNKTNDFIISKILNKDKLVTENFKYINFRNIRDKEMKEYKNILSNETKINKHLLDEAIKHNVTMYKSGITNLKEKNIKDFRIRPLSKDKRRKNLIIESNLISKSKNGFCISILNEMKTQNNYKLQEINKTFTLQYDKYYNKYFLFIPIEIKKVDNNLEYYIDKSKINLDKKVSIKKVKNNISNRIKTDNKCGIDGGIRTFLTVYSPNETYEIGNDLKSTLKSYYKKIDKITSLKDTNVINEKKYKKGITKIHEKISNKINDLHWKASNFLCKKFNTICIGKLSTRSIVNNEKSNINELTKRLLYSLSHYKFRMILKMQCEKYNCNYKEINEYETSKRCHICKKINNVGSSKIYNCEYCNIRLDRDINASINIYNKEK